MKTFVILFLTFAISTAGIFWFLKEDFPHDLSSYISNSDLLTLESRYTPEELMENEKGALIGSKDRSYLEPHFVYYPYLLCDVKYSDSNQKTKYGTILWSLLDGEMVINGDTWEKTRGFEDALKVNASPLEFRLMHALADHRGSLTRDRLQKELHLEAKPLGSLIENAKQKQLIILKGNEVILHFENPLFHVSPETIWASQLVFKPGRNGKRIPARYSHSSIERIAKAAFGEDFAIRNKREVFLPVLRLSVVNPDGTLLITDWNAVTGEEIPII